MNGLVLIIACIFIGVCSMIFAYALKKNKKISCIVVGIIALVILFLNYTIFYYNEDQLCIATSSEDDYEMLSLNIKYKKLSYEHTYGRFETKLNVDELKEEIKKQCDNEVVSSDNESIIVTINNHVVSFRLEDIKEFFGCKKYIYYVCAEFISVEKSDNEDVYIDIPFPTEYLNSEGGYSKVMSITCDFNTFADFYKNFTNVTITNNEIIINQDVPIRMCVTDGKVVIEFE